LQTSDRSSAASSGSRTRAGRTYLQVHWLTDIAGALLGSGVSLLVFAIAQLRESGLLANGVLIR